MPQTLGLGSSPATCGPRAPLLGEDAPEGQRRVSRPDPGAVGGATWALTGIGALCLGGPDTR